MSRWVMRHAVRHESRCRGLGVGMVSGDGDVLRILPAPVVGAPVRSAWGEVGRRRATSVRRTP